ncbi:MAG: hypothetical protein ABI647_14465 [Gemmatimonadota bacterium]
MDDCVDTAGQPFQAGAVVFDLMRRDRGRCDDQCEGDDSQSDRIHESSLTKGDRILQRSAQPEIIEPLGS